jgi:hypothetical protein
MSPEFRHERGRLSPVVTWLNFDSKAEVDAQHAEWQASGVMVTTPPARLAKNGA